MSDIYFTQKQLARRWGLSPRTLERWRFRGFGPRFLKLGKRIKYRLAEIETFEEQRLRDRACSPEFPDRTVCAGTDERSAG